jgi:hypothetical protein
MINAPVLVLSAAALSAIAKAKKQKEERSPGEVITFWGAIVLAAGGLLIVDRFAPSVASGLAALWIVGGMVANGDTLSEWLNQVSKGLKL